MIITKEESIKFQWFNRLSGIFDNIIAERRRQYSLWGEQVHRMICGVEALATHKELASAWKRSNDHNPDASWDAILLEEVYEAFAETDPEKQREELVQVAAVTIQIIECIDRGSIVPMTAANKEEAVKKE
jgi:hypothetical protein